MSKRPAPNPNPKVISIGYAVPELSYSQREVFAALGYPKSHWRLFGNSGIDRRYFCLPPDQAKLLSFQEQQEQYLVKALSLSRAAVEKCLDSRGPGEIGCVVYGSCTGLAPGPTIPQYLAQSMGFAPNVYFNNLAGQGCESGFPGLKRAYDFAKTERKAALVVNCELSSLTYFPEPDGKPDPENDYECLRANALFADAASSFLVGFDDIWRHPTILDTETNTDYRFADDLGFAWRNGRLRVKLSRRVPKLASQVVKPAVEAVLQRHRLRIEDICWWVIHSAGNSVLDNIRDGLGIAEEKMGLSRETLRLFGNTSSTSVGITGKRLMQQDVKPKDYVMVLSLGPGMTGGCTLLRFE
jgi:predicted naringenin-chalcone synthase